MKITCEATWYSRAYLLVTRCPSRGIYKEHSSMTVCTSRHESVVWGVVVGVLSEEQCSSFGFLDRLQAVLATRCADKVTWRLQQTQRAGTCDRFGAPLDLEFAKDVPIVSFHRVQGEEQPLAHLLIGESLRNEVEDF